MPALLKPSAPSQFERSPQPCLTVGNTASFALRQRNPDRIIGPLLMLVRNGTKKSPRQVGKGILNQVIHMQLGF